MNLYADLDVFKRQFSNNLALDAADATELEHALEDASRQIDADTRRPDGYFPTIDTRYFAGDGGAYLTVPDLLAVTSVKLDEDGDRTFALALTGTDYYLRRHGHPASESPPYSRILLDSVGGQRAAFTKRDRLVEIEGRWGYSEDTEAVEASGTPVTGTLVDASDLTLAVTADADLAVGQTLLIGSEQVYVAEDLSLIHI